MAEFFTVEQREGYALITINRPKALNALSKAVLEEMSGAIDEAEKMDGLCVVITGAGDKAFVAGADIAEMKDLDAARAGEFAAFGQKTLGRFSQIPKISIAAVNGFALGGGLELALACDIRYAADTAKLGLPETTLGLVPGFGGSQRLPRLVGSGLALEYIASGGMVGAEQALADGVVNRIFPAAELMGAVEKLIGKINKNGPAAVRTAKTLVYQGLDETLEQGLVREAGSFGELFSGGEAKEGMTAFLEKRPASF